jgi:hypothetical protein
MHVLQFGILRESGKQNAATEFVSFERVSAVFSKIECVKFVWAKNDQIRSQVWFWYLDNHDCMIADLSF